MLIIIIIILANGLINHVKFDLVAIDMDTDINTIRKYITGTMIKIIPNLYSITAD